MGDATPRALPATTLCISLAIRPSTIGTRFHNYLYEELGLDFLYKAFTTDDLRGAIAGVRALGIRGCGVSMPFKEAVLDLVDEVEDSAATHRSGQHDRELGRSPHRGEHRPDRRRPH